MAPVPLAAPFLRLLKTPEELIAAGTGRFRVESISLMVSSGATGPASVCAAIPVIIHIYKLDHQQNIKEGTP